MYVLSVRLGAAAIKLHGVTPEPDEGNRQLLCAVCLKKGITYSSRKCSRYLCEGCHHKGYLTVAEFPPDGVQRSFCLFPPILSLSFQ